MTNGSHQFCPIARAADILCQPWTMLILRDLHSGCTRFNELKRGVPRISPTLLSRRLKMLEEFGLLRREKGDDGAVAYRLTRAGRETGSVLLTLGIWGRRWMQAKVESGDLDEAFLVYAMQVSIGVKYLAPKAVVQITFRDRPRLKWDRWWLVVEDGTIESCFEDPGRHVDVFVESTLRTLTDVWRGAASLRQAIAKGSIVVDGERRLTDNFETWFRGSMFNAVDLPPRTVDVAEVIKTFSRRR
jgi:DNA-binding HxlR family transcriptional regulator